MASTSLALFSLLLLLLPLLASAKGGFSIELIHRDSPKSPLHDPSKTLFDRVREDARRSIARAERLRHAFSLAASGDTYQSPVIPDAAIYLMEVDVGTPTNKIFAIVDTGSDLIWTDCKPCKDCYPQEAPLFDPKKSSTYRDISCRASTCSYLPEPACSTNGSTCQYTYNYADGSHTSGNLASETFTFRAAGNRSVKIPKVTFGCSHDSQGTFDNSSAGIVGLGTGNLSLVSQLGSVIDKKFSYCFVPHTETSVSSKISFGANAVVSGRNVVSTPLLGQLETLYTVSLQSLTVDNDSIPVNSFAVIIDSGTTLTILDPTLVQSLEQKLTKIIHLPRVQDPEGTFSLCFNVSKNPKEQFPDITFLFDGAALTLSSLNTFVRYDENTVCLAIVAQDDLGVIGNIAQQNFHIGYDLDNQRLSFAPADCTKS
ncbi:aspartic proteinase CDR1-like [Cocos nucifera]|uniref:Aspartic proteinase CDR1-like n=1 Tax=Cocos nucifera TaxID=13894 RepID=A0A8K0N5Q8_COCNU|nr:aspartic proteinase CDR1-like [Cocos nucifera]